MTSIRIAAALAAFALFAAVPALAQGLPPLMTSPTPDSGGTVKWNTPPAASTATPAPSSSSGPMIHWNEDGTAASIGDGAPPPASASPTVTPSSPGAAASAASAASASPTVTPNDAPPPGTLPPGAVLLDPVAPPAPNAAPSPLPGATVQPVATDVRWKAEMQGDVVQVEIVDPASRYRVERVELVSPDGAAIEAREVTRIAATDTVYPPRRPAFGLGGFGGSGGSGVHLGLGMALPLGSSPPSPVDPDRGSARTIAVFYLPDPARYRRTADRWSVRVHLVDAARVAYTVRFPAPTPRS